MVVDQFSERLNTAMNRAGFNQRRLAQELGISPAAVSKWCKGQPPSTIHLGRLAEILGVDVDYLVLGAGGVGRDLEAERTRYMHEMKWYFRPEPPDGGRGYGDPAGFAFQEGLRTLARECGQNSSDAKLDTGPTAVLDFTAIEVTGEHLDAFKRAIGWDELRKHLVAATEHAERAQTAQSIRPAIDMIDSGRLHLLRVYDEGTTGLTGEEFGESKFVAVMRNTLDSNKGETAGGSFGLGRATMTASSRIGLVVSASNLAEPYGDNRIGRTIGRIELPWHQVPEGGELVRYAGPGWFGVWDDERDCTVSCWDNEALLHDLFLERHMSSTGTSFLIVADFDNSGQATTIEEMARELELGAVQSFWPAMVAGPDSEPRLQVRVRAMHNRKVVLDTYVDPTAHVPARVEMLSRYYGGETVTDIEQADDVAMRHAVLNVPARLLPPEPHGQTEHDAVLLVTIADEAEEPIEAVNTVAFMRGTRMVIKENTVRGLPVGARLFRALVLAGEASSEDEDGVIAERFLRAAEPPEHNDWKATRKVTDAYAARDAKTALNDFIRGIEAQIRLIVSAPTDTRSDGPDSLRELLRLKPAPGNREKQPRVKIASGTVQDDGSWHVSATITVPRREDGRVWVFDPVVRFASESGPPVTVQWRELRAADRCTSVSARSVKANPTARTIRIEGETVPDSQPVSAKYSTVEVNVAKARGEEA